MGNSTAQFKTLASFAKAATSSTETHFRPKKGITTIMTTPLDLDEGEDGDDVDMRAIKEKLPGVHLVKLTTMRGMMSVSY